LDRPPAFHLNVAVVGAVMLAPAHPDFCSACSADACLNLDGKG